MATKKAETNKKETEAIEKETSTKVVEKEDVRIIPKEIDLHQYVTVINGFQGRLVYISPKTGEKFIWSEFGDEQEMELIELKSAKTSYKQFFIDNWFMFNEPWIVDYLGVGQYYKKAVKVEDFDKLFELPADKLKTELDSMSEGQKKSIAYRAKVLIADGTIDSNKMIQTLEKCLGVELIEHEF